VQNCRTAGYDGRGVRILRSTDDLADALDVANVVEPLVAIAKELSVIACRNPQGATACFPTVEMEFHPDGNLVERLVSPADIPPDVEAAAEALAIRTIEAFGLCGLLAVEMFLTDHGELMVNEVAPRPHNSGHHTIETAMTSQYEQHLRGILGLPLGSTRLKGYAAMVNLLGPPRQFGPPRYLGLEECLAIDGCHVHIYGKRETRPYRKMGHVTIVGRDRGETMDKARKIQDLLRVST
jgi:5-(carboxyamino)imidazole ribonucleotide synthase